MSWFAASFADVADPRTGNAKRHDLLEVLAIALTAAVCGAEHCSDFADFAADREDLFRQFLRLENGVPSHDTFSRVFRLLEPDAFATCFQESSSMPWGRPAKALSQSTVRRCVAPSTRPPNARRRRW